jgi:DNA-directed RNA polymerase specialized sigma24 family protein
MADRAAPDDLDDEPAGDQTSALADSVVGLSYAQLAQRMGCSKTTAWERVHKAAQAANSGQLELI